jgi:hypothetical protein
MISPEEVRAASFVLNAVLVPLVGVLIKGAHQARTQIASLSDLIKAQNGRVGKMEQWTRDHEILDQERSTVVVQRIDRVQQTVEALRDRV